ncbi:MAG: sensor histidine kinase [Bacteroidia bacterium]
MEYLVIFFLIVALSVSIYFAVRYYNQKIRLQKEKQNLVVSLNQKEHLIKQLRSDTLRFQLNPHAFKNTLSTLKYFTSMASRSIDHLTEVMDYILYESNVQWVSLHQELKFLEEFIELNQLRINRINVIKKENNISAQHPLYHQQKLPPLVTVYFIENAFKHGDLTNENALVINIELIGNEFIYTVVNKFNVEKKKSGTGGIGQKNMVERLELICPGRYQINFSSNNGYYTAKLNLYLI